MNEPPQLNSLQSRRRFLGSGIVGLVGFLIGPVRFPSVTPSGSMREHPALFFSAEDLPRIRENTRTPLFRSFWDSLVNADLVADTKFLKEDLDIHNHVAHLLRANEILKRSAFVALVGENKPHADLAKLAIEKVLSFKEWDYFLEGGTETIGLQRAPETTISMSFTYDWLFDRLSSDERSAMIDAIAQKGLPPCYRTLYGMKYPDRVKGWGFDPTSSYKGRVDLSRWPIILNRTNLKMIPIAGLTIGSLLLYDSHPEAQKWLTLARESLKDFASLYGKDGSYLEGISYWGYSTQHFAMSVDVLKRMQDIDAKGLLNFPGTMRYALQMQMPSRNYTDDVVNFSDAAPTTDVSVGFWVAREFRDGIAEHTAELIGTRRNPFALIWHDKSVVPTNPPMESQDVKFDNDWVVSRSGWGIDDTVVAMRGGGPSNHEHADRNSVIVKAYGERLLHDPLGAAYPYTEKHWLLRLTEAHTAVLIDGKGHQYHDGHEGTNPSKAEAHVVQYEPGERMTYFTSDATPAYQLVNSDVKKVQRTIVFVKPDLVVFLDELEKVENPSSLQARFQAFNVDGKAKLVVGTGGKSFEIHRPTAKLVAKTGCSTGLQVTQGVLEVPVDKGIFPYIQISADPSRTCAFVTVCLLSPMQEVKEARVDLSATEEGYTIDFRTAQNEGKLYLHIGGDLPTVQLEM
ncbi:MAG: heparinase II/III family protein [Bacteroidota bacterium]